MATESDENSLLAPILHSFDLKRNKSGVVPRNWLLVVLLLLDRIRKSDKPLHEDEVYTYDYALKESRASAIPKLLKKYGFPTNLGMSKEGITMRGAPGLRIFRAIKGGKVIMDQPKEKRDALIAEAIELVRGEVLRVVRRKPVMLSSHHFAQSGTFVAALLKAVENRSEGRVEQKLVGAKLQLRFPDDIIPNEATYAGDRQTGRESDFDVQNIRVLVSVTPKDGHFEQAKLLADQNREVYLIVAKKSVASAKKRIINDNYEGRVLVITVDDYVTGNMMEIAKELRITAHDMCLKLVAEYNTRIAAENDTSLQVVLPDTTTGSSRSKSTMSGYPETDH